MRPYSADLWQRLAEAVDRSEMSQREIARHFQVNLSFVMRPLQLRRRVGVMEPNPHGGGAEFKPSVDERIWLFMLAREHPDATLKQLKIKGIASERRIFQAEISFDTSMTSEYRWTPIGDRVDGSSPKSWSTTTLVSAMEVDGLRGSLGFPGAMDEAAFQTFVEHVLVPNHYPGDIVVLDNLRVHDSESTRSAIEKVGAKVLPQPVYRPDFNPIEELWIKANKIASHLATSQFCRSFCIQKRSINKKTTQNRILMCLILLHLCMFRHCAIAQHHLEPEEGTLSMRSIRFEYMNRLRDCLVQKTHAKYYVCRMICLPSDGPEWMITVAREAKGEDDFDSPSNYYVECIEAKRRIFNTKNSDTVLVTNRRIPINRETAEALDKTWFSMLRLVRYSQEWRLGGDGVTFHFSRYEPMPTRPLSGRIPGFLQGKIWTPDEDSRCGKLAAIGEQLRVYVSANTANKPKEMAKLNIMIRDLEAIIKNDKSN